MPLVIFQNCLKFHLPNGSWKYVEQFRNITRGIYAKYHYKSRYYLYKVIKYFIHSVILLFYCLGSFKRDYGTGFDHNSQEIFTSGKISRQGHQFSLQENKQHLK